MKRACLTLVLVFSAVLGRTMPVGGQQAQKPSASQDPYASLASRLESRLRFATDFSFPNGPALQIKVYDWIIGPRQEITNFPLEGFATIEVKAGQIDTTVGGVTAQRHEGEHWVVPEGVRLDISVKPETGYGDNLVSLHAVVVIRK